MQIVALPEKLAVPMVPDLLDKKKIEAAYAKLQTYLADGRAILVGWPTLTARSGMRAVIEAIDEICYPSEMFLPDLNDAPSVAEGGTAKLDATPLGFLTRNAGVTLEVEPVVSPDGPIIDLNLGPQHVSLQGYKTSTFEVSRNGTKAIVRGQHPEFHTNKVTTSLSFGNGQRKLLGTYKVANPEGYMEFFILKVEIEQVLDAGKPVSSVRSHYRAPTGFGAPQ